jgi:ketol-acid reductoisomerase
VNRVAVYGYGTRGITFANVLDAEGFDIICIVDRNIEKIKSVEADAIVVTHLKEAAQIADELNDHTEAKIFVLEDLL